ncbi:MAG: DUF1801 domain-containing protein [Bacteroidales bacterium]|nr:DUF1801 domain-containing protein [Bacteroidales bacterium]
MELKKKIPETVESYISGFPEDIQKILKEIRATIKKAAPEAEESMSYQIPTYKQNGVLAYFAAYKKHIGFYPTPSGIEAFKEELSVYEYAKGSVKFPLDKPIPLDLIAEIIKFRILINHEM